MNNAADTPTSGEFLDADEEGRQIVKDLCDHLSAFASAGRSLETRSSGLRGVRLFRLMAGSLPWFRGLHATTGEYLRTVEKFTGGGEAITIRDLQVAPPARRWSGRKVGVAISGSIAALGSGIYTGAEMGVLPTWCRAVGFLIGLAGGGAMPALIPWERKDP